MHKRKPYAVVIITVIGFSFAVVQLFAFDLLGYRGESPGGALLIVELFPSLLAQLFLRYESGHGHHILSFNATDYSMEIFPKQSRKR